jgi:hypothetical protein
MKEEKKKKRKEEGAECIKKKDWVFHRKSEGT